MRRVRGAVSEENEMSDFRAKAEALLCYPAGLEVPEELPLDDLPIACQAYRVSKRMGLREAARQINVSPTTLSRFENGAEPDVRTIRAIGKWLGIKRLVLAPL